MMFYFIQKLCERADLHAELAEVLQDRLELHDEIAHIEHDQRSDTCISWHEWRDRDARDQHDDATELAQNAVNPFLRLE